MAVEPYLFLEGRCEEAIDFYCAKLGAEVVMKMTNKDAPEQPPPGTLPPGSENKILHASLRIGDSMIMASDGHCAGPAKFEGFSLSISTKDEEENKKNFAGLSEGGTVLMPLTPTFFSPSFGMVKDKFGVTWMCVVMHF